jgi:hypothetical protein
MRRYASTVVALLAAAGILFSSFPSAIAADVATAPTGVTIPKGYRDWQVVAPSHEANMKGNDWVFTRYAP